MKFNGLYKYKSTEQCTYLFFFYIETKEKNQGSGSCAGRIEKKSKHFKRKGRSIVVI